MDLSLGDKKELIVDGVICSPLSFSTVFVNSVYFGNVPNSFRRDWETVLSELLKSNKPLAWLDSNESKSKIQTAIRNRAKSLFYVSVGVSNEVKQQYKNYFIDLAKRFYEEDISTKEGIQNRLAYNNYMMYSEIIEKILRMSWSKEITLSFFKDLAHKIGYEQAKSFLWALTAISSEIGGISVNNAVISQINGSQIKDVQKQIDRLDDGELDMAYYQGSYDNPSDIRKRMADEIKTNSEAIIKNYGVIKSNNSRQNDLIIALIDYWLILSQLTDKTPIQEILKKYVDLDTDILTEYYMSEYERAFSNFSGITDSKELLGTDNLIGNSVAVDSALEILNKNEDIKPKVNYGVLFGLVLIGSFYYFCIRRK